MAGEQAASHGLDPSPEIIAADGVAPAGGGNPQAPKQEGAPDASNQDDIPIGGADGQQPFYRPDGIPQHLLGETPEQTLDKLFGAYKGARDELAKGKPAAPEKPEEYKLEIGEDAAKQFPIAEDDPALGVLRQTAHEAGLTQEQFGVFGKFVDMLVDKGLVEKPYDSDAVMKSLVPEGFKGTDEQKLARGAQRVSELDSWIKADTRFSDQERNELRLLTTSKEGVAALEKIRAGSVTQSVNPGGGQPAGGVSKATLDARVADPRNNFMDPKYDEAFALETREMFKKLHPE
jgi:hypothetical protein